MKWAVVMDSASDMACMKSELNDGVIFDTVALKLNVGNREFVDDEKLDVDDMMRALASHNGKSGSAAPSPEKWKEIFEKADNIVAITISGALSGSYNSAKAGMNMVLEEYPDKKFLLIDSKSTGGGMMLLARKALELAKQDVDFDTMKSEMDKYYNKVKLLFVLESMDNLMKNGRVSKFEGSVAAILGIKVVGEASPEGTLSVIKKARGKMQAYDKLLDRLWEKGYAGGKLVIGHCNNEQKADYLKSKIQEKFEKAKIEVYKLRGLDSFYAENGGIIVGYEIA